MLYSNFCDLKHKYFEKGFLRQKKLETSLCWNIKHKTANKKLYKFRNRTQVPIHLMVLLKLPVVLGLFFSF